MNYMRNKILCGLLTVILVAGCDTDELHEMNINPQAVNQMDLNFLFTAVELSCASNGFSGDNRYTDWRTNIGFASSAIQQLSSNSGILQAGDKYFEVSDAVNPPWNFFFSDQLKNIEEILRQTGPGGYAEGKHINMVQAARILRVFNFHRLTDWYGAIPYFEANKGISGNFFPKYDNQSAIYPDLLNELDEAVATLNASNPDDGFSRSDIIYGGNVAKWKKFGNSLMLRLAMRVSNVDQALTNTYVAKAIAGGPFADNTDNAWVPLAAGPSVWNNQNGISRAFYPGDGGEPGFLSKRLVDFLKGTDPNSTADDDPRLMIISGGIATWTATAFTPINVNPLEQKGYPNGYDNQMINAMEGKNVVPADTYSRINFKFMQLDEPYMLMNVAEVKLLMAEAAERSLGGLAPAAAAGHYNEGVKAAMQMYTPYDATLTVSDAAVANYLATYPYAGTQTEKLEMIGEQMWVSKFFNWWDAWSDWRRTGFPVLVPVNYQGNVTGGTIPRKMRIPLDEVAGNPNYLTGATMPDALTTRVWWDGGTE
jgi:hypothetical protein